MNGGRQGLAGPFQDRLTGARVTCVETRGKTQLIAFDLDLTFRVHIRRDGGSHLRRRYGLPSTACSLRVPLHTETESAQFFSAPGMTLLDATGQLCASTR